LAAAGVGVRGVTGIDTRNEPPEGVGVTGTVGGGDGLTIGVTGVLALAALGVTGG